MKQYLDALRNIYENGRVKADRTGTGTRSLIGLQMRFDLSKQQFPLLTTKQVFLRGLAEELFWFLRGSTNNTELTDKKVKIWNEWALEEDITESEHWPAYSRLLAYAESRNISAKEAERELRAADAALPKDVNPSISCGGEPNGGEKLLEDAGIGRHRTVVKIKAGELGPIYGKQWRDFGGVDQIQELLVNLKNKPFSRRHVISAWNPAELPDESISPQENVKLGKMALAPCHCLFQFFVEEMTHEERVAEFRALSSLGLVANSDQHMPTVQELDAADIGKLRLSCQLYQRSSDFPLGVPFNIASYALLTKMIAHELGYECGEFIWTGGDCHIYSNQLEGVKEQLSRTPTEGPLLYINKPKGTSIMDIEYTDLVLKDYNHQGKIEFPISV